MNYNNAYTILKEHGQLHVLAHFDSLDESEQAHLLSQIAGIDWHIIDSVSHRQEITKRGSLAPLDAIETDEIEKKHSLFQELGLDAIRKQQIGAVLLAGGQGTRLGLDKP